VIRKNCEYSRVDSEFQGSGRNATHNNFFDCGEVMVINPIQRMMTITIGGVIGEVVQDVRMQSLITQPQTLIHVMMEQGRQQIQKDIRHRHRVMQHNSMSS
jgi:hypothetical protein